MKHNFQTKIDEKIRLQKCLIRGGHIIWKGCKIKSVLIIGSGLWSNKIKSSLDFSDKSILVQSVSARTFLEFESSVIRSNIEDKIIWIATRPSLQIKILYKINQQTNKVILEKPFATNTKDLDNILSLIKNSKNQLYLSEPWKYSNTWKSIKSEINIKNKEHNIVIFRGGPKRRSYMSPVWDWLQHDLGLISELLDQNDPNISIFPNWSGDKKTIRIEFIVEGRFKIELNSGFFIERVETWEINGGVKIDFKNNIQDIQPIYLIYKHVSGENFRSDFRRQSWLTNKVIKLIN